MSHLRIHQIPNDDAFLRQRSAEVTSFGPEIKKLARGMLEILPSLGGIGLAAPQVGHSVRMVLIALDGGTTEPPKENVPPAFFLINPVVVSGEGNAAIAEGCLSVPGIRVEIPRKAKINVRAQSLSGQHVEFQAEGLLAIVIQHELDHLDGTLIVDYVAKGCPSWREDEVPEGREVLD